ncbi:g468 [Coccomyxa viridis]|uniref:G468 protein n=1 Tax=Coccomyxa viridis TaxID=1274662 RepID=A0ABP1FL47_9CHLO
MCCPGGGHAVQEQSDLLLQGWLRPDYKLAARVLADRLGPLLNHVVDSTQTGFLPQRWIGDNILAHLEIIAWYQRTQQPGVLLFLDFEKAFDRLDRPWLQRCMAATGFGAGAQRWVSLMHASTSAKVAFNGWHTQRFPVHSGVFQGSPLSPLLFVLAVQPMSAHARQLATQQGLHGLRLPDAAAPSPCSPCLHHLGCTTWG